MHDEGIDGTNHEAIDGANDVAVIRGTSETWLGQMIGRTST